MAGNAIALSRISGAAEAQAVGTDILPIMFASPMPAETGEPRFVITGNDDGGAGAMPGQDCDSRPATDDVIRVETRQRADDVVGKGR